MNRPQLETLNTELFQAIDPQEGAWVVGASNGTLSGKVTGGPTGNDWTVDGDYNF